MRAKKGISVKERLSSKSRAGENMMPIGETIKEDYRQIFRIGGSELGKVWLGGIAKMFIKNRGFRAVVFYRIGRYFRVRGHKLLANFAERLIQRLCFCDISTTAEIEAGFSIFHPFGLVVGTDVRAGKNLTLSMDVVLGGNLNKCREDGSTKPIIGNNVNIAAGSKVVGPVEIGNNCLVGANSVVNRSMPSDSIIAGMPARIIRRKGRRVGLLKRDGELSDTLRDLVARIQKLEEQIDGSEDTSA